MLYNLHITYKNYLISHFASLTWFGTDFILELFLTSNFLSHIILQYAVIFNIFSFASGCIYILKVCFMLIMFTIDLMLIIFIRKCICLTANLHNTYHVTLFYLCYLYL